jgi:hypothetical protein
MAANDGSLPGPVSDMLSVALCFHADGKLKHVGHDVVSLATHWRHSSTIYGQLSGRKMC